MCVLDLEVLSPSSSPLCSYYCYIFHGRVRPGRSGGEGGDVFARYTSGRRRGHKSVQRCQAQNRGGDKHLRNVIVRRILYFILWRILCSRTVVNIIYFFISTVYITFVEYIICVEIVFRKISHEWLTIKTITPPLLPPTPGPFYYCGSRIIRNKENEILYAI